MRRWHGSIIVGLSVVWGLASGAAAAPLDLKHVAADAAWLAHIDLDAVRSTTVFDKAMAKVRQHHPDVDTQLLIASQMIGMDPMKDLHGITLYGKELGKPTGVGIVHGKFDVRRLLGLAAGIPNHKSDRHGSTDIHVWTVNSDHGSHTVAVAFKGDEQLVAASSVDGLRAALDVLDGAAPSVGPDSPLAGNIPPGTTLLARVNGIAAAELAKKDPVARQTQSFRFVTGEADGQSFYRARAEMTNPEVAAQLRDIALGLRAVGMLHAGDDVQGKHLIDALRVKAEGNTMTVLWSAPAADVWDMAERLAKEIAEHMAKRREGRAHKDDNDQAAPQQPQRHAEEDF
jgi:hypothetical protein